MKMLRIKKAVVNNCTWTLTKKQKGMKRKHGMWRQKGEG